MFGREHIDSQYFDRMEARERQLKDMTERKERAIEQRIAGENGRRVNATKARQLFNRTKEKAISKPSVKRSRTASIQRDTRDKTRRKTSSMRPEGRRESRTVNSREAESGWTENRSRDNQQSAYQSSEYTPRTVSSRPTESRPAFGSYGGSRKQRPSADSSKTIGRVIRTVVILYIIFGLFAGIMPRIVGNLGEFVTDLRDEMTTPEPEPGYEVVTEEAVVDRAYIRTDSVELLIKVDIFMDNLDEAQNYLAFEYRADSDPAEVEQRFNQLQEEKAELMSAIRPPTSLESYWEFFMTEYDWTLAMLEKTINGQDVGGDFEHLNLLQYDKFAELVRVWNEEGVAYDVGFRLYDYELIPITD